MSSLPRANKNLGQHFLRSEKIIQSICSDFAGKGKYLLEVGPGPGILTERLSWHPIPLQVIEKDSRFLEELKPILTGDQILFCDALEVELSDYLNSMGWEEDVWLVSNLPYNVSTPLIVKFLRAPQIRYMTLMMQKEVGEKIYDWTGTDNPKQRGSLMDLCQAYFDIKLKCPVPPGAFVPPPKVDSVVLSFERKEDPDVPLGNIDMYESFLRTLYSKRRKQLGNVLKESYSKPRLEQALAKIDKTLQHRAESLSHFEVVELFKELVFNTIQE